MRDVTLGFVCWVESSKRTMWVAAREHFEVSKWVIKVIAYIGSNCNSFARGISTGLYLRWTWTGQSDSPEWGFGRHSMKAFICSGSAICVWMCVRVFVSHPQPERDQCWPTNGPDPTIEEPTTGQKPRNFNYVIEFRVRLPSTQLYPQCSLCHHYRIIPPPTHSSTCTPQ